MTVPKLSEKIMNNDRKESSELTLCMINYNGEKYLEESLASGFIQRERFEEILLIDNASEDKSLQIVSERFPGVKVIELDQNLGPAVARNVGFRNACSHLILFVDNDVSLTPDCLGNILKALKDSPQAAIAMPRVVYANDKNVIQFDGADCHFLGLMTLHNVNGHLGESANETRRIGSVVTSCFLIDRCRWGSKDPFDEAFFFNYEDHDFGLRARILGHDILSAPSAICYHREGTEGLSLRKDGEYSKIRVYNLIRNRWLIILKNYSLKTILLLSPILFIYEIIQFAGVIKQGWFREWLNALIWIFMHPLEIFRKRQAVQRSRKTPDRKILRGGPIPFTEHLKKSPLEKIGNDFLYILTVTYWRRIKKII